ncbi:MAG: ribonuclease III [Acidobacteria bacterium]|nr:ribonuclease III [Acidobacteriota bacterium]
MTPSARPSPPPRVSPLEAALGHTFRNSRLLEEALTPPSSGLSPTNQRLEFLGDGLLNAAVALLIHREQPGWNEGDMSKLRGLCVCTGALCDWAGDLALKLRRGPRSPKGDPGPSARRKALADAMEAVLAACFLDAEAVGDDAFGLVVRIAEHRFGDFIRLAEPGVLWAQDSKTALQETAARINLAPPTYSLLARQGPDHAPRYRVQAELAGHRVEAEAGTIKEAEREAARRLLADLENAGALSSSSDPG